MLEKKVQKALEAIQKGQPVVVRDDESRENEADLIIAAEKASSENVGFMVRHTSGIICVPMLSQDLDRLNIPPMVENNTDRHRTAFAISVDAKKTTTTGISAHERAQTIRALINPKSEASDFLRPGHVFPLRAKQGGLLKRAGHTEAGVDLARLAGLYPAAVLAEIVNEDGSVAKNAEVSRFAEKHQLVEISISELIEYIRKSEKIVSRYSQATIPTKWGSFEAYAYLSHLDGIEHVAFVCGSVKDKENVLVRVHSECLTGDIFASLRCDCGSQLHTALEMIAKEGQGAVVYLRGHEGRGIGLRHKLRAYNLQDQGFDTVQANEELGLPVDSREYGVGAQILADLGIKSMRLITNNPQKYSGLKGYGLSINERVGVKASTTEDNERYLRTKKNKLGHLIEI